MARNAQQQWSELWAAIDEVISYFGDRIVFIGGIAVYLHIKEEQPPENFIEFSHDGDFYIALADFADLRDLEEVTANRRLSKYQFIKNGFDFDVYVEDRNTLRVRYDDIARASRVIQNVRVASPEHLLVLKLDAYASRKGSAKGKKDARDLIRIAYILHRHGVHLPLLIPYWDESFIPLLDAVKKSSEFMVLCQRNAHQASQLRSDFSLVVEKLRRGLS